MDKGILIDRRRSSASCVSSSEIKKGDLVVVGEVGQGIKEERQESEKDLHFGFMVSDVSGERSKEVMIGNVASQLQEMKNSGQRILFVGGPAIIHTGAGKYLARLIKSGFIDVIFAGNALATHDLEENYFGTSLGVEIKSAISVVGGHHHHLRTINAVRFYGGIRNFVKAGRVHGGIFYECVKSRTKYILAGSIRDDGPLTDVITDSIAAQMEMRKEVRKGFGMAIMVATTLHSVATGNLLPAAVKKVIVDDNLAAVTKLADRGTNALGIVTDCAYFLSELCRKLSV